MKYPSRNARGTVIKSGPATKSRILPGVLSLLAGIAPVALSIAGNASQAVIDTSHAALRPVRLSWRVELGRFDICSTVQSGRESRLDPRLAGEWYWEADSVYVPGADILIKATSILTIYRDGGFILQEEGSECGGVNYQGQLEQQGDTLTGRCDNGQTFTTKFALDGSNGLWVAGRLYGRQ
ncbi:MAG: hypothetical protein WCA06_05135 [Terrimicrobiaceae bacterium]